METIRWPVASPTEGAERVAGSAGLSPTGDMQCLGGAATTGEPGALLRGGSFGLQSAAGPLMISGFEAPIAFNSVGFRCAR